MQVVERPDNFWVDPPKDEHAVLEPMSVFSVTPPKLACLLILNSNLDELDLKYMWNKTQLHVCADGGANRVYDYFDENERASYIPDFIAGDCDSLRDQVKQYYISKGTVVIRQDTQYSTDFMKCIQLITLYYHEASRGQLTGNSNEISAHDGLAQLVSELLKTYQPEKLSIFVLGGIGGRFDQTMHSINQLFRLRQTMPWLQVVFLTESDTIFLIGAGKTFIRYPSTSDFNKKDVSPICGLIPFQYEAVISSCGLRYDVTDWPSSMSGNVSSSNAICGEQGFWINTTHELVINVETTVSRRNSTS